MNPFVTELIDPAPPRRASRDWRFVLALTTIPVSIFYWFFWQQIINVPYQDDFDGLLGPVLDISRGNHSLTDIWHIYWTQDDERRIVMNRMAAHGQYALRGQFSFRVHCLAGSFLLLLGLGTFGLWFRQSRWSVWLFLPIPFVLFSPQYFDALQWANIPFQQVGVYGWSLLSIWLLCQRTRLAFYGAIGTAIVALLSEVTGILPFIVGGILLVLMQRWRFLLIWIMVTVVVIGSYFYHLEVPAYRPSFADNFRFPGVMLHLWLAMQGLWADLAPRLPLTLRLVLVMGLGVGAVALWSTAFWQSILEYVKRHRIPGRQRLFVYGGLLIFLGVFTLFALGRTVEGVQAAFLTRYRLIYLYWMVLLYLLGMLTLPASVRRTRWVQAVAIGTALLINLTAWFQYAPAAQFFRQALQADMHGWQHHRILPSSPIIENEAPKRAISGWLLEAQTKGIYTPDNTRLDALANAPMMGRAEVHYRQDEFRLTVSVDDLPGLAAMRSGSEVYVLLHERTGAASRGAASRHPNVPMIFPASPTYSSLLTALRTGRYTSTPYTAGSILNLYLTDPNPTVEIGVIDGDTAMRFQAGVVPTLSLPLPKKIAEI
jgi:hypothetical protein